MRRDLPEPDAAPSRRVVLGAGALLALGLGGCGTATGEALLGVDPREVRRDVAGPVRTRPRPSRRELRRRAVAAGARVGRAVLSDPATAPAGLPGAFGGSVPAAATAAVHAAHLDLLVATAASAAPVLGPQVDDDGPVAEPARRAVAVLGASVEPARSAALEELRERDADPALALLLLSVGAARWAQATALGARLPADAATDGSRGPSSGRAAPDGVGSWPTAAAPDAVVEGLQALLASAHRARWSYPVVQAWAGPRAGDARLARDAHTTRVEALTGLLRRLGREPVAAAATYPTAVDGRPVDGPDAATALGLALEDDAADAAGALLLGCVTDGSAPAWSAAATAAVGSVERARWSWGGDVRSLPGY